MNSTLLLSQLVLVVGNQNMCTYAAKEHTTVRPAPQPARNKRVLSVTPRYNSTTSWNKGKMNCDKKNCFNIIYNFEKLYIKHCFRKLLISYYDYTALYWRNIITYSQGL